MSINVKITLNVKFYQSLSINSLATLATFFITYSQTDRHFPEIVKSCSGHPKTYKSIKNRKSKICTKPVLSSNYTEESKNNLREHQNSVALELF